jgi:hypothetical protein
VKKNNDDEQNLHNSNSPHRQNKKIFEKRNLDMNIPSRVRAFEVEKMKELSSKYGVSSNGGPRKKKGKKSVC